MKRLLGISVLVACAAAGLLSAFAFADDGPPGATTATTTTATTATTPAVLAEGVVVGGVPVGGLTPGAAIDAVRSAFATPLPLRVGRRLMRIDPTLLAAPNVKAAVARAEAAQPNTRVGLVVVVRELRVHEKVAQLATRFDRPARDAQLLLRHLRPFIVEQRPGRSLLRGTAERLLTNALRKNRRDEVVLPGKPVLPKVTQAAFDHVIVIRRGSNRLFLYRRTHYVRSFPVATGQSVYPTPLGRWEIVVKWRNPWWYPPPNAPWAVGEKPAPPGPGNPLGTRWMGLSAPGVGIHGTNNESSIGYSVSHGCIRMHVPDSEWLFEHVEIGTPVFIVSA